MPSSAASTGAASVAAARRPPGRKRRVERGQVHEHLGVLRLHALDVRGARRRALLERAPEPLVLALVVGVQAERQRVELRRDGIRVGEVARARRARTSAGPSPNPRRNMRWISIIPLASQVLAAPASGCSPPAGSGVAGMVGSSARERLRRRFER